MTTARRARSGAGGAPPRPAPAAGAGRLDLPEEADDLLGHVVRLEILVGQVLERTAAAHGTTAADYLVLATIRRSPGHRSAPTAICEVLGRTTGGMTLTLDRLEKAGWVRRLPDPADRRRIVVEATEDGVQLAKAVNADLHDWEDALALDAGERRRAGQALSRLTTAIESHPDT